MPKPWTDRRAAAYHRAVAMKAARNLRALGLPLPRTSRSSAVLKQPALRLSDILGIDEARAEAVALVERWAAWAKRDTAFQPGEKQMAELGRQVDQHFNDDRTDRFWRSVAEMRRVHGERIAEIRIQRDTAKKAQLARAGNAARQRLATRRARGYVKQAKELRRKHPEWSLGSIIAQIRRTNANTLSARQIRRHLAGRGVK